MPSYFQKTRTGHLHISGDLGPHCADCAGPAINLCDYPIGGGLTCDRSICEEHSHTVGRNAHYCDNHYAEYRTNNPGLASYQLTQVRYLNLPGMTQVAMAFLKEAFDLRDPGNREHHVDRFLLNSAIRLGRDVERVAHDQINDAPNESLAGGLAWGINKGLIRVCWRKPPGWKPQPWFALTRAGLAVMEGQTVDTA